MGLLVNWRFGEETNLIKDAQKYGCSRQLQITVGSRGPDSLGVPQGQEGLKGPEFPKRLTDCLFGPEGCPIEK